VSDFGKALIQGRSSALWSYHFHRLYIAARYGLWGSDDAEGPTRQSAQVRGQRGEMKDTSFVNTAE
jgi:hypothetical protein